LQAVATPTRHHHWFLGRSEVETVKLVSVVVLLTFGELKLELFATWMQYVGPPVTADHV